MGNAVITEVKTSMGYMSGTFCAALFVSIHLTNERLYAIILSRLKMKNLYYVGRHLYGKI